MINGPMKVLHLLKFNGIICQYIKPKIIMFGYLENKYHYSYITQILCLNTILYCLDFNCIINYKCLKQVFNLKAVLYIQYKSLTSIMITLTNIINIIPWFLYIGYLHRIGISKHLLIY